MKQAIAVGRWLVQPTVGGKLYARGLHRRGARVRGDDICPEPKTLLVALRHADSPASRKSIPEKEGCSATHPGAAVSTEDEELGDIEIVVIVGRRRTTRDQRKAGEPSPGTNEKGKAVLGL
jgi:hypothetical protein